MTQHRSETLSQQIAEKLLNDFKSGIKYKPGDKLPNENDLSEEYGISRGTLRESIRILTAGGILEVRRGIGTFVAKTLPDNPVTDLFAVVNSHSKVIELYEFRLILEPQSAMLACKNASDEEIANIIRLDEEFKDAVHQHKPCLKIDQRFHSSIAKMTHNSVIYDFTDKIQLLLEENEANPDSPDMFDQQTIIDHETILHYLKKRDMQGAQTAMRMHIYRLIERLESK